MYLKGFLRLSSLAILIVTLAHASAQADSTEAGSSQFSRFSQYSERSVSQMDFTIVDQMLHAGVVNMGPSTRAYARSTMA